MPSGMPVPRDLLFVLKTGEFVLDVGDARVQDVQTGDFLTFRERDYGRAILDGDLETLKNNGVVISYTPRVVYLRPLPEPPRRTIE
jgi:hypothetical protein